MGDHGIRANGIAFRGSQLYASVSDAGRRVRVAARQDGSAGPLRVVLERGTLRRSADGIAFDPAGNLWIVTNGANTGRVPVLANGELTAVGGQYAWLDYPAMPVFGPSGTLFVENCSFLLGTPSIVELH
jgi:sugar lactone lactonase YvrE